MWFVDLMWKINRWIQSLSLLLFFFSSFFQRVQLFHEHFLYDDKNISKFIRRNLFFCSLEFYECWWTDFSVNFCFKLSPRNFPSHWFCKTFCEFSVIYFSMRLNFGGQIEIYALDAPLWVSILIPTDNFSSKTIPIDWTISLQMDPNSRIFERSVLKSLVHLVPRQSLLSLIKDSITTNQKLSNRPSFPRAF